MAARHLLVFPLLLALKLLCPASILAQGNPLAIRSVSIVDVAEGSLRPDQTVVVQGERIVTVGDAGEVAIPAGADVIDGSGRYLIPGLWDMHVHSSGDRVTRETFLPLYVANGVTGVRDMHADCLQPCADDRSTIEEVRAWSRDIAAGRLVGPRIVAASRELNGPSNGSPSTIDEPATAEHGRALVALLEKRGVDFIMLYDLLPRAAYFALIEEASRRGLASAGHVPVAVRASEASDAGQRSIEHLTGLLEECSTREDEVRAEVLEKLASDVPHVLPTAMRMIDTFDEQRCEALFERFVANRTWHVPTLLVHAKSQRLKWREHPGLQYVSSSERAVWDELERYEVETLWGDDPASLERLRQHMFDLVRAMHVAGVRLLAGSDAAWVGTIPGFSLHEELELLVAAGLTPAEALRAATLGPVEYLEVSDSLGAVEPGRLADLVLLDANPLEDIRSTRKIRAVLLSGRHFDREALDTLLAEVRRAAAARQN